MLKYSYEKARKLSAQHSAQQNDGPKDDPRPHNMALEAFLLHFRILADFYGREKLAPRRATDVFAWEFNKTKSFRQYGDHVGLNKLVKELSPRLAHLSAIRHIKHDYRTSEIVQSLMAACEGWQKDLDPIWTDQLSDLVGDRSLKAWTVECLGSSQTTTSTQTELCGPIWFTPEKKT